MEHSLEQELRDAGYTGALALEPLIEACGDRFTDLHRVAFAPNERAWKAKCCDKQEHKGIGDTPTIAAARLWLALQKK